MFLRSGRLEMWPLLFRRRLLVFAAGSLSSMSRRQARGIWWQPSSVDLVALLERDFGDRSHGTCERTAWAQKLSESMDAFNARFQREGLFVNRRVL